MFLGECRSRIGAVRCDCTTQYKFPKASCCMPTLWIIGLLRTLASLTCQIASAQRLLADRTVSRYSKVEMSEVFMAGVGGSSVEVYYRVFFHQKSTRNQGNTYANLCRVLLPQRPAQPSPHSTPRAHRLEPANALELPAPAPS